jgi:hypothetical protein
MASARMRLGPSNGAAERGEEVGVDANLERPVALRPWEVVG